VKFKDGDDLVLLVNNQGGMSALEMGAVVDETLTQLGMSFLVAVIVSSSSSSSSYSLTSLPPLWDDADVIVPKHPHLLSRCRSIANIQSPETYSLEEP